MQENIVQCAILNWFDYYCGNYWLLFLTGESAGETERAYLFQCFVSAVEKNRREASEDWQMGLSCSQKCTGWCCQEGEV